METRAGVVWNAEDQLAVLGNGIYYSYISFSTIGYGGIGPIGWGAKLLAASQGMLNGLLFTCSRLPQAAWWHSATPERSLNASPSAEAVENRSHQSKSVLDTQQHI